MRTIENEMRAAISALRNWKKSNTEVRMSDNVAHVYLHGNEIARIWPDGRRKFSNAGFRTATTKSRLNALGAGIYQRNYNWYNQDGTPFVNAF